MPKQVIPIRNRLCKLKKFHLIFVCKCRKNILGKLYDDITEGSMQDSLTATDLPYRTGLFTCVWLKRDVYFQSPSHGFALRNKRLSRFYPTHDPDGWVLRSIL
jgi:hypothetical protein